MLIDWFTVVAQTANFLILVWLLKRYLYHPILNAIDAREKRIAAQLLEAAARQDEALQQRDEFQRKNDSFEQQRAALVGSAVAEAGAERQQLLEAARQEAEALHTRLQEMLNDEQRSLSREISARTQREVFAVTRKVLADLADESLEQRMVAMFIRRLQAASPEEREQLRVTLAASGQPAVLRSAFELNAAQQAALVAALGDIIAADIPIRFETASDQVSGIELVANGHKLAWSIREYLAEMERNVTELLHPKAQPETQRER